MKLFKRMLNVQNVAVPTGELVFLSTTVILHLNGKLHLQVRPTSIFFCLVSNSSVAFRILFFLLLGSRLIGILRSKFAILRARL